VFAHDRCSTRGDLDTQYCDANNDLVVGANNQSSRFARNVRATLAHDNADVCSLECRRVVDAIASHGHHMACRFEGFD
jgi:hypothetical protein